MAKLPQTLDTQIRITSSHRNNVACNTWIVSVWPNLLPSSTRRSINQSVTHARRVRLQNLWTWQKTRLADNIHNVFVGRQFKHFDATVLLPL